jgi:4a-hydroxytetrahydrobiopterin dehydratase
MDDAITIRQFHESQGADAWRVLSEGAAAFFRTGSFAESARFVAAIGALDGIDDHPPALDVRHDGVTVRLITVADDYYGMTRRDADLAARISLVARDQGLAADASVLQSLLVIPGAASVADVMPFWRALLDYRPRGDSPDEDLVDPRDRGPAFWFEAMDEARPDGGGAIHVAVWLPRELAEARVAATLAAGGRIVRDTYAPAWWTLADAAGNEADIATAVGRD